MTTPDSPFLAPLPGEGSRPYAARMMYTTMGNARSLDRVAQQLAKSLPLLKRWSSQFNWVDCAREYDQQLALRAAQVHQEAYLAEIESHRRRYGDTGRALHAMCVKLLYELNQHLTTMDYSPASLGAICRAITTAADLEAHSLRLAELLPRLGRTNAEG